MTIRRPLTLLALLAPACLPASPSPAAGLADPPSFALMTDTPAYCGQLARQVADRHSPVLDVQRLLAEGRELCDRGEVRGGIRRLRRALVLLHHGHARGEPPT